MYRSRTFFPKTTVPWLFWLVKMLNRILYNRSLPSVTCMLTCTALLSGNPHVSAENRCSNWKTFSVFFYSTYFNLRWKIKLCWCGQLGNFDAVSTVEKCCGTHTKLFTHVLVNCYIYLIQFLCTPSTPYICHGTWSNRKAVVTMSRNWSQLIQYEILEKLVTFI